MLSNWLEEELARCLALLESDAAALAELVTPRSHAPNGLGVSGSCPSSRPPVSVPILDLKVETEELLAVWCSQLLRSGAEVTRAVTFSSIGSRAAWLRENLSVVAQMPWAQRCAEEIVAQALTVHDVVAPPLSADDPSPVEVGTIREIVAWARHLRREVSRSTVQRWAKTGVIPYEVTPDGRVLVALADVLEHAPLSLNYIVGHPRC